MCATLILRPFNPAPAPHCPGNCPGCLHIMPPALKVMETAFIYQGKLKGKRVRPARIYYIRELDQKYYRITGGGGSD